MKKVPMRRCIGCHKSYAKGSLLRIVKNNNVLCLDDLQKMNGTGHSAYLCRDEACLKKMEKSRALERSFKITAFEEAAAVIEILRECIALCRSEGNRKQEDT